MHRQALRSVCLRARQDISRNVSTTINSIRTFTTTQSLFEDKAPGPRASNSTPSSARQRGQAAASEVRSVVKNSSKTSGAAGRPDGSYFQKAAASGDAAPKILSVRSLPRGGLTRGRGGLRGRGGFQGQSGRPNSPTGTGTNRFAGAARGRGGAFTRGKPRGGMRTRKPGDGKNAERDRRADGFSGETIDQELAALDQVNRFGAVADFEPKIDQALMDLVPGGTSTPAARRAAVLKVLETLGSTDSTSVSSNIQISGYIAELEKSGVQYFADPADKQAVKEHLEEAAKAAGEGETSVKLGEVQESLKQLILDQAVLGKHEAPQYAEDTAGTIKSQFLRSSSYRQREITQFEAKLNSILGKIKAAPAPKQAPAPAKKGKAKAKTA